MLLHTKYQGSKPCGFRHDGFFMCPYLSLCKPCDPGWVIIGPRGIILTNVVERSMG